MVTPEFGFGWFIVGFIYLFVGWLSSCLPRLFRMTQEWRMNGKDGGEARCLNFLVRGCKRNKSASRPNFSLNELSDYPSTSKS
mmetsp:Transcript_6920/g.10222  ORF Transcript_6920/g.10222 Transcript_6920/m.10222 type:complete len:83 (-) Transcript_6920:2-250(-)